MSPDQRKATRIKWLSEALNESIANLGYPVGMGQSPHPKAMQRAAEVVDAQYQRWAALDAIFDSGLPEDEQKAACAALGREHP